MQPATPAAAPVLEAAAAATDIGIATAVQTAPRWSPEGEQELKKIPFFVRGKARRNTETYAAERGIGLICVETLYEAKAHFGR
jgi:light-independent protochlorophyllide reductase subunit B